MKSLVFLRKTRKSDASLPPALRGFLGCWGLPNAAFALMLPGAVLCLMAQPAPRPSFSEPAIDPDRQAIAFVSGGDIWQVPINGGDATLLVSSPFYDSRPLYSPDGRYLAFESNRTGNGDIYLLTFATGEVRRLTFDDATEHLDSWSRDSGWLYFSSTSKDLFTMSDVFKVKVTGGTPIPVAADRYASEFFAAPSPDGKIVAINARGIADRQWWRKGHSHLDQSEILLVKPGARPSYERISDGGAKELWPQWAPDGKSIYFVSDRDGAQNLWRQPVGGTSRPLTTFKDGRVLWPNLSYDGKTIAFERDFGIWRTETGNGKTQQLRIALHGAVPGQPPSHMTLNNFSDLALSPDGKKIALIAHGEVFAASAKTPGEAQRVTRTAALEDEIVWTPDSRKLAYLSSRNGSFQVFLYDFTTQTETQITNSTLSDAHLRFSPDGKQLAFVRNGKELMLYDLEGKKERSLAKVDMDRQPLTRERPAAWSPDNKWLAFQSAGARGFTNVLAVPTDGSAAPRPVSFLANSFSNTLAWSPDGTFLLFDTSQRTEPGQIARVDLLPKTPKFREDDFLDLFKTGAGFLQAPAESAKPAATAPAGKETKPVTIVWEGVRERLHVLPLGLDAGSVVISPDGKTLVFQAVAAGQRNLYSVSLEERGTEPAVARQITSTPGGKRAAQFSPDGKELYFLEQGRVQIATLETRAVRPLAISAEMDVDFQQEKLEIFQQVYAYQRDHFFDDRFNGVDWEAARRTYEPYAAGARTIEELHRAINLMLGELNASHSGISLPFRNNASTVGRLGVRFDPLAYEQSGKFVVSELIPLGPAAIGGVKPGEELLAVDGNPLGASVAIDSLLDRKIGKRVELKLAARTVAVLPVNLATEKRLLYRSWVAEKRAAVDKLSNGKLGYVHIPDMSSESLTQFYLDLDVDNQSKDGVVVDVRNNNGGFVNVYAIDVLARRPYLTMTQRGRNGAPARSVLGQRSLELPTVLLTNQHSLSDAEDFTEGYRRLKLGKVVGEPTAGWIVYTWNYPLLDGSQLRLPRVKVFDTDGQLMEMHPRPVDIPVERPVGESYLGSDIQLETAVKELLGQLK